MRLRQNTIATTAVGLALLLLLGPVVMLLAVAARAAGASLARLAAAYRAPGRDRGSVGELLESFSRVRLL